MAVYSRLPVVNLTDADIADTLLHYGGTVDKSSAVSFFQAAANIDIWSKWKPIHTGFANDDFLDMDSSHWASANYGLKPVTANNASVAWSAYKKAVTDNDFSGLQWGYNRPTGTSASPYRLGDFRGYNPEAKPPFHEVTCESSLWTPNQAYDVEVYNRYGYLDDGQVALSEMSGVGNLYIGVMIGTIGTEGAPKYVFTGGTVSQHYGVQKVSCRIPTEGTYYIAPVLCQSPDNTSDAVINSNVYTLLPVKPIKIVVEAAVTATTLYGDAYIARPTTSSSTDIHVKVVMTNANTTALAFDNVTIQVGRQGNVGTVNDFSQKIGDYSVASYNKVEDNKSFLVSSDLYNLAEQGKLYYRIIANGGSFTSGEKQLNIML